MLFCKSIFIALILFFVLGVTLGTNTTASAACRDNSYAKCGTDTKCLAPCLKRCGGDNVPPVPAPKPVKK